MTYPHASIWINGRQAAISDIVAGVELPRSDFETNTFTFIRDWLNGREEFRIRTSGSTGTPKVIAIRRDQMIASARMTAQALGLQEDDSALVCLDTKYIAGQMMLVRCFTTGMKILATDPVANPFHNVAETHTIDFTALVPYQVQEILHSGEVSRLDGVRNILIGGAALDEKTRSMLQIFRCRCFVTYGMTETISHIALQRINGETPSSYFEALPGVSLRLDDRSCLVINAPHLIQAVITNDIAELIGPGKFRWTGRWDNVINSGGVKISPERLEEQIGEIFRRLAIDRRFYIAGVPDERLGNKVVLIVEGEPFLNEERTLLDLGMKENMSKLEIPKDVLTVKEFTFTETGKINRISTLEKVNIL
jgi:O-succinylbenzoic acid--CoA ligase